MLVINPTSPTKNPMEFKAIITTLKDFPNNNTIEWENFIGIQLNPIELQEEEKGRNVSMIFIGNKPNFAPSFVLHLNFKCKENEKKKKKTYL